MAFLVSVPEASKALGVSKAHLYRLIKRGKVPSYKLSARTTRIDPDELRDFVRLTKVENPSSQANQEGGRDAE